MKLANVYQLVKEILTTEPATREDDYLLWLRVIQIVAERNNIHDFTKTMRVESFLLMTKFSRFPNFESVSRTRRKAQEENPELRAGVDARRARAELETEYRAFAQKKLQNFPKTY